MTNEFWDKKEQDIQIGQAINLAFDVVNMRPEGMTFEQRIDQAFKLVPMIYRKSVATRESIRSGKALFDADWVTEHDKQKTLQS